jgi:hypothetical protein
MPNTIYFRSAYFRSARLRSAYSHSVQALVAQVASNDLEFT